MRISDWSSYVCSSDLHSERGTVQRTLHRGRPLGGQWAHPMDSTAASRGMVPLVRGRRDCGWCARCHAHMGGFATQARLAPTHGPSSSTPADRSEEHTSELQSLLRISYAVFCVKKTKRFTNNLQ